MIPNTLGAFAAFARFRRNAEAVLTERGYLLRDGAA